MIYLISSNSYHLLEEEINKIFSDNNYEVIDFLKTDIDSILEEFGYNDLFNTQKNLVIKNCSFFEPKSSVDGKKLENYLENPNQSINVIFTCNGVDERKKIVKIIKDKYHYNVIKPLNYKDIASKLLNIAKSNLYKLKIEDAQYITSISLNNYDLAYNNLEKIFLYYNEPCDINTDDVYNLCSITLEDNNFKFVDNVVNKNVSVAFNILNDFKIQKVEPIALFNLLAREFRLMLLVKSEYNHNSSRNNIIKKIGLLDWQLDKLLKEASNYSIKEIENKLLSIFDYDYKIKSGKIDKFLALEMFILED